MSFPIRYSMLLISLCLLTACASPRFGSHHFLLDPQSEQKEWVTRLAKEPGQITITTRQDPGSRIRISLVAQPNQHRNPLVDIIISDVDCEVGHQIIVAHFANQNDVYRQYFNTTIPWQSDFTLSLSWDKSGTLAVTLGDETIKAKPYQNFVYARIESTKGVLEVKELRYTKTSTVY